MLLCLYFIIYDIVLEIILNEYVYILMVGLELVMAVIEEQEEELWVIVGMVGTLWRVLEWVFVFFGVE